MYSLMDLRVKPARYHARTWARSVTAVLCISMIVQSAEAGPTPVRPQVLRGDSNRIPPTIEALQTVTTQDLNSGLTPADLVTALLGPGVAVSNVTFTGANTAAGTFGGGTGIVGFDTGIILSSGNIAFVPGPNSQDDVSGVNAGIGDPDLDSLIPGYTTFDASILEFDFQCAGTQTIQFRYVFTSEEYNEWVNSPFNDVFGFFLNGVNIALVPGSPGTPVSINNVNCGNPYNPPLGSFCNLFINNDCNDIPPGSFPCNGTRDIQMDGMIVVLTTTGTLSPGVNHIKLAVADAGDQILDSNVFIQGQSFVCGDPTGACCETSLLTCTDNVLQANCQGPNEMWTVGLNCNQLDPPCPTAPPPDGTDCTNPIPIISLPFSDANTTSDKGNDYTNTCLGDYDNGHDIVYELTITGTQCIDITVAGATPEDIWIGVALDSVCPPGNVCMAQGTSQAGVATITNLTLTPGAYYLLIDRWPLASASLDFTLSITDCGGAPTGACCNAANQVCTDDVLQANCQGPDDTWNIGVACGALVPPCESEVDTTGQDCEFPIFVTSVPFDDVNSTADKKEDYAGTCLGVYDNGNDIVYHITLTNPHCLDIRVAGATAIDHSIGVVLDDVCPPGPSCLAQASTLGTEATITDLQLSPGTYYLMVDRQPDEQGFAILNFRLSIADCPAASGACCLPDGQCAQVTEADCVSANGLSWTMEAACSPNACVPVPDPVAPDPSGLDKTRFITFAIPPGSGETALRVNLVSLHHVVPPYTGGLSVPFASFEGEVRWVGPPISFVESNSNPIAFFAAFTQCTPHYQDWSTVGVLHVTGSAITPSSLYEVENVSASCIGAEESCTAVSGPLAIGTTRWGDVEAPYNPPSITVQPDVTDIGALVNKFRSAPGAPIKARALLAGEPGNVFGEITPAVMNVDLGFSHISACVDAFRGVPYPYTISSCP